MASNRYYGRSLDTFDYRVGQRFSNVELIKMSDDNRVYTFLCDCGNVLERNAKTINRAPEMCKECAKARRSSTATRAGERVESRKNTADEDKMIQAFLKKKSA